MSFVSVYELLFDFSSQLVILYPLIPSFGWEYLLANRKTFEIVTNQ